MTTLKEKIEAANAELERLKRDDIKFAWQELWKIVLRDATGDALPTDTNDAQSWLVELMELEAIDDEASTLNKCTRIAKDLVEHEMHSGTRDKLKELAVEARRDHQRVIRFGRKLIQRYRKRENVFRHSLNTTSGSSDHFIGGHDMQELANSQGCDVRELLRSDAEAMSRIRSQAESQASGVIEKASELTAPAAVNDYITWLNTKYPTGEDRNDPGYQSAFVLQNQRNMLEKMKAQERLLKSQIKELTEGDAHKAAANDIYYEDVDALATQLGIQSPVVVSVGDGQLQTFLNEPGYRRLLNAAKAKAGELQNELESLQAKIAAFVIVEPGSDTDASHEDESKGADTPESSDNEQNTDANEAKSGSADSESVENVNQDDKGDDIDPLDALEI